MSHARTDVGPHIHSLIAERWSPRAFRDRAVEPQKIRTCLEAARWAPSCFNEQPWTVIVGVCGQGDAHARLADCLVTQNQRWALAAPVLMLTVAKPAFDMDGRANRHAQHDVGLATMNLMLQAHALGLVAHAMAGFKSKKAREAFGIPADHEPMTAIALGYPGDPNALPDDLAEKEAAPRNRRPLAEWVFDEAWSRPATVVATA